MRHPGNLVVRSTILPLLALVGIVLGPTDTVTGTVETVPRILAAPPLDYYCAAAPRHIDTVRLRLVSKTPNAITDEDRWFAENDVAMPEFDVPNPFLGREGQLPDGIPTDFRGTILVRAISWPDAVMLIYGADFSEGRYLVVLNPALDSVRYAFDFAAWSSTPGDVPADRDFVSQAVVWAREKDGVLYLCHSHRTYAESSNGLNAYVTALDPATGRVLWRSRPLVCNSRNFELVGDCVVCGYGFTAEPDYLYILDRFTGRVLGRILLKTAPDYIIRKAGRLYVRCYDTDYVYDIVHGG